MKTKSNCFISLTAIVLLVYACNCKHEPYCDNSERYSIKGATIWDGDTMARKEAIRWVNNFYDSTTHFRPKDDNVKGVFISKQVLDKIFEERKFNGIFVYFALSESGEFRLLTEGGTTKTINVSNASANAVYRPRVYCPPVCGDVGKPQTDH